MPSFAPFGSRLIVCLDYDVYVRPLIGISPPGWAVGCRSSVSAKMRERSIADVHRTTEVSRIVARRFGHPSSLNRCRARRKFIIRLQPKADVAHCWLDSVERIVELAERIVDGRESLFELAVLTLSAVQMDVRLQRRDFVRVRRQNGEQARRPDRESNLPGRSAGQAPVARRPWARPVPLRCPARRGVGCTTRHLRPGEHPGVPGHGTPRAGASGNDLPSRLDDLSTGHAPSGGARLTPWRVIDRAHHRPAFAPRGWTRPLLQQQHVDGLIIDACATNATTAE